MTDAGRKISGRNISLKIFLPLIFLPAKDWFRTQSHMNAKNDPKPASFPTQILTRNADH
jgi:hypothetical protein